MPVLNQGGFDIFAFYSGLTGREVKDWLKGKARYGVFIEQSIPVFLLDLGKVWSLDVYFNMFHETEATRQAFFEGDPGSSRISLILAAYPEPVIQAVRTLRIDPDLMLRLKEACFDQLSRYRSKDECFVEAEMILEQHNSKALRAKTAMQKG
jgi:hypothetical protein